MPCKCNPRPIPRPSPPLQWPSLPTIPIPSRHYNATPHRRLFQSPPAITMPAHCHRSIAAHCARSPSHYNALRYVPDVPRRRYNGPHQSIPSRSLTASRPAITMAPLGRRHCSLSPPLQCPPVRSRHPSPPLQWPSIINPFPLAYSVPSRRYNGTARSPPLLALSVITRPSCMFPTSLAAVTLTNSRPFSIPSCHYNGTARSPPLLALPAITMPFTRPHCFPRCHCNARYHYIAPRRQPLQWP
jgi:hypothetical protein